GAPPTLRVKVSQLTPSTQVDSFADPVPTAVPVHASAGPVGVIVPSGGDAACAVPPGWRAQRASTASKWIEDVRGRERVPEGAISISPVWRLAAKMKARLIPQPRGLLAARPVRKFVRRQSTVAARRPGVPLRWILNGFIGSAGRPWAPDEGCPGTSPMSPDWIGAWFGCWRLWPGP